jgi:hypothetical protein
VTRSIYLLGAPGVGKSTTLTAVLDHLGYARGDAERLHGLLWGQPLVLGSDQVGVELGRQRDAFSGTDALGMAVAPDALAWVEMMRKVGGHTAGIELVVAEGARLGIVKFLVALAAASDLTLVHLHADDDTLDARCTQRGSNQSPAWRRGAATRAENAFLGALGLNPAINGHSISTRSASPADVAGAILEQW